MNVFSNAEKFIYRNARPLDLCRWNYHFEGGSKEAVVEALSYYQNDDGGFGYGLEADLWNRDSSPIVTSTAIGILKEIDFFDAEHKIIKGILSYLENTPYQEERGWFLTIPSNNDYPHSAWWTHTVETQIGFSKEWEYNPTAILAGFILKVADKTSMLYRRAEKIAIDAIGKIGREKKIDMHEAGCFCMLLYFLKTADIDKNVMDVDILEKCLRTSVNHAIEHDVTKWSGYCAKPSQYFLNKESVFYLDNKETADYECEYIMKEQLPDGSYPVTWTWGTEYKEFEIAANWWKSHIIITNMLYLQGMGKLRK